MRPGPNPRGLSQKAHSYPPGSPTQFYGDSQSLARSSYPAFLSLPESLMLQLNWAWRGLVDAFRWDIVVAVVYGDPEIRANFFKSLLLNALSLASIYVFDLFLQPLIRNQQKWLHRNLGWFYSVLWLLPVVGASFYLNSAWCTVIAKRTFTLRHGMRQAEGPVGYSGLLTSLATSAYRGIMVGTSVVVSLALSYVPVVGYAAGFMFFCWVDAYYCYEFVWIARGFSLAQRIRYLEERWAYFLAFGVPSSVICMMGSALANAALFALVFPSYVVMAMHGTPSPYNPYNPASATPISHHHHHFTTHNAPLPIRYPSPFIPIRIPVFAPILWLNDHIVRLLSVGGAWNKQYTAAVGVGLSRPRGFSDSTVESVEEGAGDDANLRSVPRSSPAVRTTLHDTQVRKAQLGKAD